MGRERCRGARASKVGRARKQIASELLKEQQIGG
jgi:hypothetical protein